MDIKPLDLVNSISVFQLAVFTFFLFHKGRKKISNIILASFFIAQFLVIGNKLLAGLLFSGHPNYAFVVLLTFPVCFVWGPLMYFYVRSQVQRNSRFKPLHLLHTLPFLLALISILICFYSKEYTVQQELIRGNKMALFLKISTTLLNLQVFCYNTFSLFKLINYQRRLKDICSSVEKANLGWLKIVLYGYIIACIINELIFFANTHIAVPNETKVFIIYTAFLLFFNVLYYKAMISPHIFITVEEKPRKLSTELKSDITHYAEIIRKHIEIHKPYLNPMLTLREFSEGVGLSERIISQVINQCFHRNFFTFINSFRIEEAKKLLSGDEPEKSNLLGIALDAGFNSKSVFYDAFKKYVGMTPNEFRKQCA